MTATPSENPFMVRGVDRVLTVQRPAVLAHIRHIRRLHPNASPEQVVRVLERHYLTAVTTGGALTGATAVIPAIGTATSVAISSVETAVFLEASALFAQSVSEVHGIAVRDPDRARTLVMTMILGDAGTNLVRQLAGQVTGTGPVRTKFWGELVTKSLPQAAMGQVADQLKRTFLKRFAVTQSTNVLGRAIPFGIGAVVGGTGNHLLGKQIIRTSREGFGPAPLEFPAGLEPRIKTPRVKAPREKTVRAPGPRPSLRETAQRAGAAGRKLLPGRTKRAIEAPPGWGMAEQPTAHPTPPPAALPAAAVPPAQALPLDPAPPTVAPEPPRP